MFIFAAILTLEVRLFMGVFKPSCSSFTSTSQNPLFRELVFSLIEIQSSR